METIQLIRDLAIIVFVGVALLATTLVTVMAWNLYRKASPMLDDAQTTARNAARITGFLASDSAKPVVAALAALGGAGAAAAAWIRHRLTKEKAVR